MQVQKGEWRLILGFGILLLLILIIGIIGIYQIYSFSQRVEVLGSRYLPIQKTILGMKVSNNLYAANIRNYIFWRFSRYLEAAKFSVSRDNIQAIVKDFQSNLNIYSDLARASQERQWIETVSGLHGEVLELGSKIIDFVDEAEASADEIKRERLREAINKMVMSFEAKLYMIDNLIDNDLQNSNLAAIKEQIRRAGIAKKQGVFSLASFLIFALLLGSQIAWFVYRNRKRERERRFQLVQKMIKFEEKERQNLSFQIHNQMSQDLSALKIYLGITEKKIGSNKEIQESKKIVTGLMEKADDISELLRPPALDEVGLPDMIEALILHYKYLTGTNFIYRKPRLKTQLSSEYSLTLYRIAQEAFTNIAKHSAAKNVEVDLSIEDRFVELSIRDDGAGFDYRKFLSISRRRKEDRLKLGLLSLKERIEILGGSMWINTAPKKGTGITVRLNY